MARFERNQLSLIEKKIDEKVSHPQVGIVDEVFPHTNADDDSNFEVSLKMRGNTSKETIVPVYNPGSDTIAVPKVGDKVVVLYRQGSTNTPIAIGTGYSIEDRAPLGRAGMYRNRFESGTSPAGDGSLNIMGYTSYDKNVANADKRDANPEETFVQISKHPEDANYDPAVADPLPAKIEMYDSPANDEAWISVEINKENGADSDATWGMKFNIKTGEWKLVGPSGFGITSDGAGNFTWQHKSIDFDEVSGSTGDLSL